MEQDLTLDNFLKERVQLVKLKADCENQELQYFY